MKSCVRTLGIVALLAGLMPADSQAAPILWTDWTTANSTTAAGTMGGITVGFSGNLNPAAQTSGGINYWSVNPTIFTAPPTADNPPPDSDIIRLIGGTSTGVQTITFSSPVTNPVMAIMSLGQPGLPRFYTFGDEDFTILKSGQGYWGGNPAGSLFEDAGNVLRGIEGHGLIQFNGTFTSIDWTVPVAEDWHGFQVGVAAVAPEPATMLLMGGGLATALLRRRRTARQ